MYAIVDAPVLGITVVVLSALFNRLIVWIAAMAVISLINIWACSWLDREWDVWSPGRGRARSQVS